MRKFYQWQFKKLIRCIVATLLNKYDFFLTIEGGTGTGKSTLALLICLGVSREFKKLYRFNEEAIDYYYDILKKNMFQTPEDFLDKIVKLKEKRAYYFNPRKDLIYSQKTMQTFLSSWNAVGIADEMVNITFNRDFQTESQKNIVKMINMYRDHENLILACVPYFQTLDNQIKNLCKMKITIKKRGIGIIHTPNKVIYCKDKWDSATNEKIERNWIMKKIHSPNYAKLTTFRGVVKFPKLPAKIEELYQQIKNEKRAIVLKEEMGIEEKKEEDPIQKFTARLIDGGIRNSLTMEGFAIAIGTTPEILRAKIKRELSKRGKPTALSYYYWDKKAKKGEDLSIS